MPSQDVLVIGLGYVGLPLATAAARSGFRVTGLDTSEKIVTALMAGRSHVDDVTDAEIAEMLGRGFRATTDEAATDGSLGPDPTQADPAAADDSVEADAPPTDPGAVDDASPDTPVDDADPLAAAAALGEVGVESFGSLRRAGAVSPATEALSAGEGGVEAFGSLRRDSAPAATSTTVE